MVTNSGSVIIPPVQFPQTFYISVKNQVAELPGKIVLVYINLFLLLPYFLLKQRYFAYTVGLLLSFMLMALIQKQVAMYLMFPWLFPRLEINESLFSISNIVQYAASAFSVLVFTSSIKILLEWQANQKFTQELEKQRISSELQLLKTQLNPHFFFNTLNNLYGLAMENSGKTAKMILRLSDMMSYLLYDSNGSDIHLKREIEAINNYIELEKIRYGNRVSVSFQFDTELNQIQIPPLLFLPFVENAFKHGVTNATEMAWINITVFEHKSWLNFKLENSKTNKITENNSSIKNGIGLENVRRRLELLYPKNFEISIDDTNDETYLVSLKLKIHQ